MIPSHASRCTSEERAGKRATIREIAHEVILSCVAVAALSVGCSGNNSDPTLDPVNVPVLLKDMSFSVSNQERQYHLYLPRDPDSAPIVLLLIGNGGSNDQLLGIEGTKAPFKLWLDVARQENLILVVPNGSIGSDGRRRWNDCRNDAAATPESDDVQYIRELIEFVRKRYGSSTASVFSLGVSNGGLMTMRLAAEAPEMLDAMAVIVASRPVNSECLESTAPIPVLIMNGTDDPILPYGGGRIGSDRGDVYSTAETVSYWVVRNQTNTSPVVTDIANGNSDDDSTIFRFSYSSGNSNSVVEHYEVINGGHTEPSIAERYGSLYRLMVGNQNGDVEMATEIWNFFETRYPSVL